MTNYLFIYNKFCDLDNVVSNLMSSITKESTHIVKEYDAFKNNISKDEIINIQNLSYAKDNKLFFLVLKNFEYLNKEIVNSLLLFLENPPKHFFCIFSSSREENVLNTIKSRCEIIYLPYKKNKLNKYLKDRNINFNKTWLKIFENEFNSISDIEEFINLYFGNINNSISIITNFNIVKIPELLSFFKDQNYFVIVLFLKYWFYFFQINFNDSIEETLLQNLINNFLFNSNRTLLFNEFIGIIIRWKQLQH